MITINETQIKDMIAEINNNNFVEGAIILPLINEDINICGIKIDKFALNQAVRTNTKLPIKLFGMEIWVDEKCKKNQMYIIDKKRMRVGE